MYKNPYIHRWVIVGTMVIAIVCNYLDRQLLSILKPEILGHFNIGDIEFAWILNVFLICYAVMYPVSGILVDKFGPKPVMFGVCHRYSRVVTGVYWWRSITGCVSVCRLPRDFRTG